MRSAVMLLSILLLVGGVAACGGGGGGDEAPACNQPSARFTLALEGENAPGTGGQFTSFGVPPQMSAAAGGWAAFVARTSDPVKDRCAYVAEPDGTVVLALAAGDGTPDLPGGQIDQILRVWMGEGGWLAAWITVTGAGPAEGLVSARVDGGIVQESHGLAYLGESLPDLGNLDSFEERSVHVSSAGRVFFGGTAAGGDGFWKIEADGTDLELLVGNGSPLGGVQQVAFLLGTTISRAGTFYAFIAEQAGAGSTRSLHIGEVGTIGYEEIAEEGDTLGGVESIDVIPEYQPLAFVRDAATGLGSLAFKIVSNLAEDHLLVGRAGQVNWLLIAREGDDAPGTTPPGGGAAAPYGELNWLNNGPDTFGALFAAEFPTLPNGTSLAIYASFTLTAAPALAVFDGAPAPSAYGSGVRFTENFLGLGDAIGRYRDGSTNGAFTFANTLSSGTVAAFWVIPACGLFTIARPGQTIPGGTDTFTSTAQWRVTTANGVAVFQATTEDAGVGIFRRGP